MIIEALPALSVSGASGRLPLRFWGWRRPLGSSRRSCSAHSLVSLLSRVDHGEHVHEYRAERPQEGLWDVSLRGHRGRERLDQIEGNPIPPASFSTMRWQFSLSVSCQWACRLGLPPASVDSLQCSGHSTRVVRWVWGQNCCGGVATDCPAGGVRSGVVRVTRSRGSVRSGVSAVPGRGRVNLHASQRAVRTVPSVSPPDLGLGNKVGPSQAALANTVCEAGDPAMLHLYWQTPSPARTGRGLVRRVMLFINSHTQIAVRPRETIETDREPTSHARGPGCRVFGSHAVRTHYDRGCKFEKQISER